jgi:hypothetical protein
LKIEFVEFIFSQNSKAKHFLTTLPVCEDMKAVTSRQLVQYESPYRKKAFSKGGLWTSKRRKRKPRTGSSKN